jgi:hypothetical protein
MLFGASSRMRGTARATPLATKRVSTIALSNSIVLLIGYPLPLSLLGRYLSMGLSAWTRFRAHFKTLAGGPV